MVISTNQVEIRYILTCRCQSQEEMMRSNPYEQRTSSTRHVGGNSRWSALINTSLVTIAFIFVVAVTFGLLG